jgi:type IV pilus assembly protein PilY1
MQGEDVLFQNPYNRNNPQPTYYRSRPNILGDIFHSTPVLVTPPAPTYLCDLGIVNQCVASLYSPTLEPGGQSAYQTYFTNNQYRTEFVLVGGNDGMIHAFNAGNDTVVNNIHSFDNGTGDEMWAFIPPDMLPKLIRYVIGERHELLVDGTAMVRDIWVDGSGSTAADHQKQYDEYHTVAIIGEREGGRHWTGLEVTDPMNPRFLWLTEPPGTTEDLKAGGSWSDLGPAPAPIGAIAEYDASGSFSVNGSRARERYVFAAGGGYDPAYLRGRSFHVFDAWTGQEVWRYARADSSGSSDPRNSLYPIAAPVSLLDTTGNGIFDTAVVGDVHGQVWTVSMYNPGVVGANGRYSNWYAGRAFIQFNGQGFYKRSPFFQRAAAAVLPNGALRLYLGSGDRDQIKDANGGTCGLANLESCLRKNCSVSVSTTEYRVGAAPSGGSSGHYYNANWSYTAGTTNETTNWAVDTSSQGDTCSDVDDSNVSYAITCGSNPAVNFSSTIYCDWGAGVDGGVECPSGTGRPPGTQVPYTPPAGTIQNSNFYSIRLFDSNLREQFSTSAQAAQYDNNALTETSLVNATDGGTSSPSDNGYYVAHTNSAADEKTASSALVLGGCALWNTLVANPNGNIIGCGANATLPLDTAYGYQADLISGAISCGQVGSGTYNATARYIPRATYVAPEQPAMVISVNSRTGQVAYSGISIDPGSPPASTTVGSREVSGTVHWLEVPRKTHECRHNGVNCN